MTTFEMTEWVARSPKEVFQFVTDSANAPKVSDSVTRMEKLTDGTVGVGTRYRETRLMDGKEQQTELEVVAFENGSRYSVRNETQGIETIYEYMFRSEEEGTRINLACNVNAKGLKKAIVPVVINILKKEDGNHLQQLKLAMEG
ncbi:MAG: SRPBCC family protein [Anaerolineales bacterium]